MQVLLKFFLKIGNKEILPNSSYETRIALTLKPEKHIT